MGPEPMTPPVVPQGQHWNWCRKEIAEWLIDLAKSGTRFIAGIDHAFSFPIADFERYGLKDWDQFLGDFAPTGRPTSDIPTETAGLDGEVVEELWEYAYSRYD